jgi:hypothetical protein
MSETSICGKMMEARYYRNFTIWSAWYNKQVYTVEHANYFYLWPGGNVMYGSSYIYDSLQDAMKSIDRFYDGEVSDGQKL